MLVSNSVSIHYILESKDLLVSLLSYYIVNPKSNLVLAGASSDFYVHFITSSRCVLHR